MGVSLRQKTLQAATCTGMASKELKTTTSLTPGRPRWVLRMSSKPETRRALPRTMGPSECEPEMTTQNESLDRELS